MYLDGLTIIFISVASAVLAEGINWLLIYRTEDYKRLKKAIDLLAKKLDKKKETIPTIGKQKSKDKRVALLDEQLKAKNKDMSMVKFKSMFFVMLTLLGVFGLLTNMFDGVVVAKLPFTPFPLIRSMTHRNLPGSDETDCSMTFLYVLCSFSVRSNVQRIFGFAPTRGVAAAAGSLFSPPSMPQ